MRLLVSALLLPLLLPAQGPVSSDTLKVRELGELTVTAERRPTAATVAPVRVVSSETMRRRAAIDLVSLLRDIPGVQVDPVVGSGNGISMQGLGSDRILVLIDGTPMPGRISNEFDLTRLNPRLFDRVEVVEGPQSTLYGSSALGGVINLITRAPGARRAEISTQGGSFGHLDLGARLSGSVGSTILSIDAGRRRADVVPGLAEGTGGTAERYDAMVRAVRPLGAGVLNLRAMHTREDQEYLTGANAARRESLNRNLQTDILGTYTQGGTELRAHVGSYDHTLRSRTLSSGAVSDEPQVQSIADVEAVRRTAVRGTSLVLGLRGEYERTRSDRLDDGARRNLSVATYASSETPLGSLAALSAGVRVTTAEVWGTNVAPRLGIMVTPAGALYLKAGVARGFRAPSFLEQFADYVNIGRGNYAIRGNADLAPERSWNTTAEVGMRRGATHGYVRGYVNQLRDFIETEQVGVEGNLPVFSYRNVGRARTAGVEVGGAYALGVATLTGSYAWLDTEDEVTGRPLLGRAAHTVRGALRVTPSWWSLEGEVVRASATPISQNRTTGALVEQGAWPRVNVRAAASIGNAWQATLGVDNVGDVLPENATAGFGRRVFAGLTWGGAW